jgi:thiol-disulfide isomerase/thioredoxin
MTSLRDNVRKALDRVGEHTIDDVLQRIGDSRAFPFYRNDSVVIVEFYPYLRHSELACWVVAGDLDDCFAVMPAVEQFGRELGAKYIRGAGRLGWERVLKKRGWKKRDVVMYKEL